MEYLSTVANRARTEFDEKKVERKKLIHLFEKQNPDFGTGADIIVDLHLRTFPFLACELATIYMQYLLQDGEVTSGSYVTPDGIVLPHTFLMFDDLTGVDITADQFRGPKVYVGPIVAPWLPN